VLKALLSILNALGFWLLCTMVASNSGIIEWAHCSSALTSMMVRLLEFNFGHYEEYHLAIMYSLKLLGVYIVV
jgi:hypothetical protein